MMSRLPPSPQLLVEPPDNYLLLREPIFGMIPATFNVNHGDENGYNFYGQSRASSAFVPYKSCRLFPRTGQYVKCCVKVQGLVGPEMKLAWSTY